MYRKDKVEETKKLDKDLWKLEPLSEGTVERFSELEKLRRRRDYLNGKLLSKKETVESISFKIKNLETILSLNVIESSLAVELINKQLKELEKDLNDLISYEQGRSL